MEFSPKPVKTIITAAEGEILMNVEAIKTESEYRSALARIKQLWDTQPDTPEAKELVNLVGLVEDYEEAEFPIS